MPINIEAIITGLATGIYKLEVGSQFNSIWHFDGLSEAEATFEEYADFGAPNNVNLCHSKQIEWFGKQWSVILAYRKRQLNQVTIYTENDQATYDTVHKWLSSLLGAPSQQGQNLFWTGKDGDVTITIAENTLHICVQQYSAPMRLLMAVRRFIGF